ncbi:CynX/NimT family MFS transporter [Brevibacillus fluminis]|uniref:CynX/NimT family MFS transporter n=1 Tax=Brevibacillus fluminis TaxID=511487 RepID=UPI003F8B5EFB
MQNQTIAAAHVKPLNRAMLLAAILLVACNLRPTITSVGPLVGLIRTDTGISNGLAGFITTLPLLSFAVLSPVAPKLAQRFGNEWTIFSGLIVLIAGTLLRSTGEIISLFVGTALIGSGIAIFNVLLPSMVKQTFSDRVGLMTGLYSMAMSVFAALASGLSIPLAVGLGLGWENALGYWALLAVVATVFWLPQLRRRSPGRQTGAVHGQARSLWKSGLAWQVTFFMGLQSFLFYCTVAWLPAILQAHGMSVSMAGWMLSLLQFAALPVNFAIPVIADRLSNQKVLVVIVGLLYLFGIAGLLLGSGEAMLIVAIVLLGLGQGASISLALVLIGLRAANASQAAKLSGMSQSVGYLLAAIGPTLVGFLYDQTHAWSAPLTMLLVVSGALIAAGLGAGRNRHV